MNNASRMETATRAGFAARGIMYLLIAFLALWYGRSADQQDALKLLDSGGGRIVLAVMAIGFFAYGIWRLAEAWIDSEGHGSGAKGIATRIGGVVSGLVHLGLGLYAARLAAGRPGGNSSPEQGAAATLELPGGEALLMVAAAGLLVAGAANLVKAVKAEFLDYLDPRAAREPWVRWVGRAGHAARGVVFAIMAGFCWRAADAASAAQAGGIGDTLGWLTGWPHLLVAAGLGLFGVFSLVEARHRRINDPQVLARLQGTGRRLLA